MVEMSPWFVVDGRVVARADAVIPAWDAGATTAEGLFETLLVSGGRPIDVGPHLERMTASAVALGLRLPARAALEAVIEQVVAANADWLGEDRAIRLTVTPTTTWAYLRSVATGRREGLHLWRVPGARALPQHKTLAWYPVQRLHPAGADPTFEAVWLDHDGAVLEGNTTNLFAVIDGVVFTAPTTRPLLPGVTRQNAIAGLASLGIRVREDAPSWAALVAAPEAFASSSTLPIAPIRAIEGAPKNEGPVTRALRQFFEGSA